MLVALHIFGLKPVSCILQWEIQPLSCSRKCIFVTIIMQAREGDVILIQLIYGLISMGYNVRVILYRNICQSLPSGNITSRISTINFECISSFCVWSMCPSDLILLLYKLLIYTLILTLYAPCIILQYVYKSTRCTKFSWLDFIFH